jgi:hypothetical protein
MISFKIPLNCNTIPVSIQYKQKADYSTAGANICPRHNCEKVLSSIIFFLWCNFPRPALTVSLSNLWVTNNYTRTHARTHTHIPGRTPLNESTACCRSHYLYNELKRRTPLPLAGFEPAILEIELPQTGSLDRTANGIGSVEYTRRKYTF